MEVEKWNNLAGASSRAELVDANISPQRDEKSY